MTSENNGMIMPVTPAYGGNGGGMAYRMIPEDNWNY